MNIKIRFLHLNLHASSKKAPEQQLSQNRVVPKNRVGLVDKYITTYQLVASL